MNKTWTVPRERRTNNFEIETIEYEIEAALF